MEDLIQHNTIQTVGRKVRERRAEMGLTQKMLALRSGTSISAICKIETGVTDVNLSKLTQIAEALNLGLTALFPNRGGKATTREKQYEVLQKRLSNREEEIANLNRKIIYLREEIQRL